MQTRLRSLAAGAVLVVLGVLPLSPALSAQAGTKPPKPVPTPTASPGGEPVGPPIEVDPPAKDGNAHHPLLIQAQANGVDASPLLASGTPAGYSPNQIRSYLGLTNNGAGQTIAIVVAYNAPNIAADLATFDSTYGIPAPPSFKKVSQTGSTTSLPVTNAAWALETSLDVEWAHAIAPGAGILLVEAKDTSLANLDTAIAYAAKQTGVSVISNSWGSAGEISGETAMDTYCKLTKAVCVFATGDVGNPGGYPAYNPYVVAVGGTSLSLTSTNTVASETAWGGSGGGVSIYETKPAYQSALPFAKRTIPDVSFNADPATGVAVYDSTPYNGASGWFQMGGTSAGAPQWAGILAVANQLRKLKGKLVLSGYYSSTKPTPANTAIYSLTTGSADITSGSTNGSCGVPCTPALGYDAVTGLGSPRTGIDVALANAP